MRRLLPALLLAAALCLTPTTSSASPNLVVTDTFHITVNADGTMTANVSRFSLSCNG
jgi:hypothetical protein